MTDYIRVWILPPVGFLGKTGVRVAALKKKLIKKNSVSRKLSGPGPERKTTRGFQSP
jgi:hypothetical protein